MATTSSPIRVLLAVIAVVILLSGSAVAFDGFDGMPRPTGMRLQPDHVYGPNPQVKYQNKVANCTWYGWENEHYLAEATGKCIQKLWNALSIATDLAAFTYFIPTSEYYDPNYDEYFCASGCFKLSDAGRPAQPPASSASPPAASPPTAVSPPPSPIGTPPLVPSTPSTPSPTAPTSPPTPTTPRSPPPGIAPPPPATLFRPPPPPPQGTSPPALPGTPGGPSPSGPVAPGPGLQSASGSMLTPPFGSLLPVVAIHFVTSLYFLSKH